MADASEHRCPDCAAREAERDRAQENEARLSAAIVWGGGGGFLLGSLVSMADPQAGVLTLLIAMPALFLLAYWRRWGEALYR